MEDRILKTLRFMAWEKVKGELKAMLQTFWEDSPSVVDAEIEKFIKRIEGLLI